MRGKENPMRLAVASILLLASPLIAIAQSNTKCSGMAQFRSPGMLLEISRAAAVPEGRATGRGGATGPILPAHCRVDGMIDRRMGSDGKTYGIRFAIALPDNWSGQFLQQGGGGLNGSVAEPTGAAAAGDQPALVRGFAVATTDTGHQGTSTFDGAFMQDQLAALDFEYVAIGRVANLAKQIIENYYGRPPAHSYFVGCSTGGREAMLMTQRYPMIFDGVVAGSPAMRTGLSNLATRTVTVELNKIAPKGPDGRPVPGGALSDGDRKAIIAKLLDVCDARDGAKVDGCLSAQQVAALQKGFAGPKDSQGNQVYPGFFFDTGITATGGGIPGLLGTGSSPIGPPVTSVEQNIDAEAASANGNPASRLGDTASWTSLNTFSGHGGKLIFYHGVSDPWFSAKDTIDYYQRMTAANGGEAKVKSWSRLFLSPGMGHCSGGSAALDTFDLLTPAVNWVEKNSAPESVVATGRAFPGRSRPLCAFPAHAQYAGQGDTENAANYVCQQ
jgi:feruloyl esterase